MPACADALHAWRRHVVIDRFEPAAPAAGAAPGVTGLTAHWVCLRCGAHRFEPAWPGTERRRAPRGGRLDARA